MLQLFAELSDFISHMVQMKAWEDEDRLICKIDFISHMVQMKEKYITM